MKSLAKLICLALLLQITSANLHAQPKLWGTTPYAGNTQSGTIFEFDLNGNQFNTIYDFHKYNCAEPRFQLLLASNNKFYGIASGGIGNFGSVIYEYDPQNGDFKIVHDFFDTENYVNYSANDGYLMQASNGKVYGYLQSGGASYDGRLFEFDITSYEVTFKVDFEELTKGKRPYGGMCEGSDAKLYGVTAQGGSFGFGVLFTYDPSVNLFAVLKHFNGTNIGGNPYEGVIQGSNGLLYGMNAVGGAANEGVIYQYDIGTNILTVLHEFSPATDGGGPMGRLFQASDGNLYGMTTTGGAQDKGVIFQYNISQSLYTVKVNFNGTNGAEPHASLIEYNGVLWGMTKGGGINNEGTLFRYDFLNDEHTKLADLYGEDYGRTPLGNLSIGPDGTLFGQTWWGGVYPTSGIMFEYFPATSQFLKRFDFRYAEYGSTPRSSPIIASDGLLYGTCYVDGPGTAGTIYTVDPSTHEYEVIYSFDNFMSTGGAPEGGLMEASNGMMYGLAHGGTYADGILYAFNPTTKIVTILHNFDDAVDGSQAEGRLLEASNGKLYGVTTYGGANVDGTLFEYDMQTSTFSTIHDFLSATTGTDACGTPIEAANGKIYGLTKTGGAYNRGVLYSYDPVSSSLNVEVDFDGTNKGYYPVESLLLVNGNDCYGVTTGGGINGEGVLFKYNTESATFTKLLDFDITSIGGYPQGSLMQASNGKIYGSIQGGCDYGFGGIFEFDHSNITITTLYNFEKYTDRHYYDALIEVESDFGLAENNNNNFVLQVYPNPASSSITLSATPGTYQVAVFNQLGQLMTEKEIILDKGYVTIDIEHYEAGIFIIRLMSNDRSLSAKFIKSE